MSAKPDAIVELRPCNFIPVHHQSKSSSILGLVPEAIYCEGLITHLAYFLLGPDERESICLQLNQLLSLTEDNISNKSSILQLVSCFLKLPFHSVTIFCYHTHILYFLQERISVVKNFHKQFEACLIFLNVM